VDEVSTAVEIRSFARNRQSTIRTGDPVVDLGTRVVSVDDEPVPLTGKEYCIFELLSLRKGTVLTKQMLLDHLYGGKVPCCTDQLGWGLGPSSVEDGPPLRERDFAVAGRGCTAPKPPRAANRAEQSQMGGRYPTHNPPGCPPCHSRPMPIAVTTSPSSGIG
jgi:hypothetical protein